MFARSREGSAMSSKPIARDKSAQKQHTETVEKLYNDIETEFLQHAEKLHSFGSDEDVIDAMVNISIIVERAWSIQAYGRDVAVTLCNTFGTNGGIYDLLRAISDDDNTKKQLAAMKALEQMMTVMNRARVAKFGLETIINIIKTSKEPELKLRSLGIVEHAFKSPEGTVTKLVNLGGLDVILMMCRSNDEEVLKICARGLTNCAMYSSRKIQKVMIKNNAHNWLFTLAFSKDPITKYYASLAIAFLAVNQEIEQDIQNSETLSLVERFVATTDPITFGVGEKTHSQGRSKDWVKKLQVLLVSRMKEPQSLAVFTCVMQAHIKQKQHRLQEFYDANMVIPLRKIASSTTNNLASSLAARALRILGETIPAKLTRDVSKWEAEDVEEWLDIVDFGKWKATFCKLHKIDGDLLLTLTDQSLNEDLTMTNGVDRRRFLRELNELKKAADYDSCDPEGFKTILQYVGDEYTQYTYPIVRSGLTRELVTKIKPEDLNIILKNDCNIEGVTHRAMLCQALTSAIGGNIFGTVHRIQTTFGKPSDVDSVSVKEEQGVDVFISYRRSTGSQLASLLKVFLQLNNMSVFLDVEKLEAGQFEVNLLSSVRNAKAFVLVLTDGALDKCLEDKENKDWVHREIVTAVEAGCHIIPVLHQFKMPPPETIPADIKPALLQNGVKWVHDYQDACVDKLLAFLQAGGGS